jgi:cell division protein ZapA
MNGMNQIEVSIMGQSYRLGCPDGGESRLREAVAQVDREMCAIRDSGKLKARERIAVLAALNLAYLLTERAQASATTVSKRHANDVASGPSPALAPSEGVDVDASYLDTLIARLDQTLEQDGHLI